MLYKGFKQDTWQKVHFQWVEKKRGYKKEEENRMRGSEDQENLSTWDLQWLCVYLYTMAKLTSDSDS